MEKERLRESRSNACRAGLSLLERRTKRWARGSTLYCTWRGNRFFFLENNTLPSSSVGGWGADGGGGRPFPCFFVGVAFQGWEEALREGAYCTQEKTALKRWGGGWVVEGPPGNDPNHTTYILCFL